ncbi:unnamed protein product [Durusdinium trenchii]|uniref:NHR domain-containing protein n=1 Tax=Durusdinium trenchii TaxID=1381693 RepID=A0ABP0N5S6_9DINO
MSIKFREAPCGELVLKGGGLQILRKQHRPGVPHKDEPKMAFSAEPLRSLAGRGCWFELRVDAMAGGELCPMGLGFTATDPEMLRGTEEEPAKLPGSAAFLPKSYVGGYLSSVYWDGEKVEVDNIFEKLKPAKTFTVGVLATVLGGLEFFINRRLVLSYAPEDLMKRIDLEQPLWAVLDCAGGLKKVRHGDQP